MKSSPPGASNKAITFTGTTLQDEEDPFSRKPSNTRQSTPQYGTASRRLDDNKSIETSSDLY